MIPGEVVQMRKISSVKGWSSYQLYGRGGVQRTTEESEISECQKKQDDWSEDGFILGKSFFFFFETLHDLNSFQLAQAEKTNRKTL